VTVPQADDAERSVLGGVLLAPHVLRGVRDVLSADDFWKAQHQEIFRTVCALADAGLPVDAGTVGADLSLRGLIGRCGGYPYLFELGNSVPTAVNATYYADQVRDASSRRKALILSDRIRQAAETTPSVGTESDRETFLTTLASQAVELDVLIEERLEGAPVTDLHTWDAFLVRPQKPDDWIIPGLLARQDVVMILGGEGAGKSWLSRQLAQCLPAGVHPFKPRERISPMRTLLVDLEVSETTLISETKPMSHQVAKVGEWAEGGYVWHHPQGLNLRDAADVTEFERRVALAHPDVIFFGSLYNAYYAGRDSYEQVADEIRGVFNRIRSRFGCALWIEHHMPKGDGVNRPSTPYGSSVWQRWVTHGRAMHRITDSMFELRPFRGDRGVRDFPAGIQRGGKLPVSPIWDQGEIEIAKEGAST
jgi:replicative DNA helicase